MRDSGFAPAWGPGRHGPGDNAFNYFLDPFGIVIEYTAEVEQIDDSYLAGLPDVQRTLRGRVAARYTLTPRWTAGLTLGSDLRNRDGSATLTPSVKYRLPSESGTLWELSLSTSLGNRDHLQTFYGITPAAAAASGGARFGGARTAVYMACGLGFF